MSLPAGFALKVDVDTHLGLREGVPRLLDLLARHGVRASFFVTMGPDRTGRAAWRVLRQKGFLAKMIRSRAPRLYPLSTMLRGTLLPSIPVVASQPERLREIEAAGHEVGIHGFDHVAWHDRLRGMTPAEVAEEVERAAALFEEILGRRPDCFAAPGWQCTGASLRVTDGLGVRFRSDTRGRHPYRPCADGYRSAVPEIPTTLPTLDEVLGRFGEREARRLATFAERIAPDGLSVHTVHAEVEGAAYLDQLDALLTWVRQRMPVCTLGEVRAAIGPAEALPLANVSFGRLPGRGGTVACQEGT